MIKTRRSKAKAIPQATPQNIMIINVATTSQSPDNGTIMQLSGAATVQQLSSQPQSLPPTTPAAATYATQQSNGATQDQQSSQPQVSLTTAPALVASSAAPLHPDDFLIRQPGYWTRFRLSLCCVSNDNYH